MKWKQVLRGLTLALLVFSVLTVSLYSEVPFYQDKTITVILSTDAWGFRGCEVKGLTAFFDGIAGPEALLDD